MKILAKIILILTTSLVIPVFAYVPVHAAEINPDPTTYSYGSTSESSGTVKLEAKPAGELAPTGQSQRLVIEVAIILLVLGGGTAVYMMKKKHA